MMKHKILTRRAAGSRINSSCPSAAEPSLRLHVLCSISDEDDIINALWIGFLLLQELLVVYNQFINQ